MKEIELPDGTIGEFPDTMDDAAIKDVLRRKFPTPAPAQSAPTPDAYEQQSLGATMGDQVRADPGTALKTGIARSITKTVRGVGTTLLPKSVETWLESKGILPSARDVELLEQGTAASPLARGADIATTIATDTLPVSRALRGATTLRKSLPRAAAVGAGLEGVRAEEGEVLPAASLGGLGGALGGVAGEGVGRVLSNLVRPSTEARELMRYGVTPTLGQGVDKSRITGRLLGGLERQLETMPLTGAAIRGVKERNTRDLFNVAADMGTLSGQASRTEVPTEVVRDITRNANTAINDALSNTTMRVTPAHKQMVDAFIDQEAARTGVSQATADAMKIDLNRLLWDGVRNGRLPAQSMENIKENLFKGLPSTRNNDNAQRIMQGVAGQLKQWVDASAAQSGHDLTAARHAASVGHSLRRAGVDEAGVTGPGLRRAVRSNDAAVGSADTATRELRDVADVAGEITNPRTPFQFRSVDQMIRGLGAGTLKEGLLGATGGLGHAAALGYGAINQSPALRRLLMNDPQAYEVLMRGLRPASVTVGESNAPQ